MSTNLTIRKPDADSLRTTADYDKLRELGQGYIEDLGSDFWSDYNIHDPGITVLEMLCYALTDLDYRTAYPIRDILDLEEGKYYFHTARESLTMNPVTVNDYRKLLINLEGIRNAWLVCANKDETNYQEVEFGLDVQQRKFTYNLAEAEEIIKLGGLYKVLLEFEESEEYGDLNRQEITKTVTVAGKETDLKFVLDSWSEIARNTNYGKDAIKWIKFGKTTKIEFDENDVTFVAERKGYEIEVKITFTGTPPNPVPDPGFECYKDSPKPGPEVISSPVVISFKLLLLVRFEGMKSDLISAIEEVIVSMSPDSVINFYHGMMKEIMEIVLEAECTLMEHRNLCEDYLSIDALETEDIAICADIEVKPDANIEEILAEIWFRVGEFIAPTINFYTLAEMKAKGFTVDKIFNGPKLDHGFILDEEMNKAILRSELHASDLFNIIMDIPGVVAVRNFLMVNYVDGIYQTEGEKWVLPLINDNLHVPRLNPGLSSISFYKGILPDQANLSDADDLLREKKAMSIRGRLSDIDLDIPIPIGADRDIESYTTIQNGFPLTYGIGIDGIPGDPDDLRNAQARQLKGYLLFFDQMLSNYLSQLNAVKTLFSMEPVKEPEPALITDTPAEAAAKAEAKAQSKAKTYFVQAVKDIKGVEDLYSFFGEGWNVVENKIYDITETPEQYRDRRNRFLNHLIARFAESFSEYSLMLYALRDKAAPSDLIRDKTLFLIDYPIISANRMKAFNYRPKNLPVNGVGGCEKCEPSRLWSEVVIDNTEPDPLVPIENVEPIKDILDIPAQLEKDALINVSGFKKRVSRMLGIETFDRRNLTCHCFTVKRINYITRPDVWIWQFKDPADPSKNLLTSVEYESEEEAKFMVTYAIVMIEEGRLVWDVDGFFKGNTPPDFYDCCKKVGIDDLGPTLPLWKTPRLALMNPCDAAIACSPAISSKKDRILAYNRILRYVNGRCNVEGFHLVEHILLRPRRVGDDFFTACFSGDQEVAIGPTGGYTEVQDLFFEVFLDKVGQWRFRARNRDGLLILYSESYYQKVAGCQHGIAVTKKYCRDAARYQIKTAKDGRFYFNIVAPNHEIVATSKLFASKTQRQEVIDDLLHKDEAAEYAEYLADAGSPLYCKDQIDPYSFRISVVIPAWARRFRDLNFRKLMEKTLRMEAPAHVALKICWVDRWQMADFECAYQEWLFALGKCDPDPAKLTAGQNNLIDRLEKLKNIYPVATLHDCEDSDDDSPRVVLNNTTLGSL